ncbi:hypothetical protein BO94DRAFT_556214 [Aspergillus sclerotioniger CBS 115572]|uniref:Zn(2)-C6 fungal-type domain-containing protein n=1 Tax=Aspergillus sclerotioniger CBS 115572 TaxID=1450535 RepID=A0A317WQU8_9EURO|nr:hypothetical protein BO94DRAFT_556214 [Aspergillus sclerotioniger CBS 115572]PWY88819.1 hypothetical protein BO94DRAFT_556214 [Aspergillus sclerotioniger CBS 115572]
MDSTIAPALDNSRNSRSTLACLPCRSRHVKCDGKQPSCSRCDAGAKQCLYARSRRGGLDRATLAERRKQRAAASQAGSQQPEKSRSQLVEIDSHSSWSPRDAGTASDGSSMASPAAIQIHADNIANDPLIDSYYRNFHNFHPFLLPQSHLMKIYQDPSRQSSLRPLIATVRLVGYIVKARGWSLPLKEYAEAWFLQAPPTDPVLVQCRLLYSIVLFWYDYKADAKSQIDAAIHLAIELQMFRQEFAAEHGASDPVVKECWRRTWWMLYTVDAYFAGTLGTMTSELLDIDATVELPCEESEYESGDIPKSKTLQEFDCREFASDETAFSSFAYLIGAVRCAVLALSTSPKMAVKEDSMQVIQAADSILDGWLLLLPKDRKQVMAKTGEVDELMFQAHLLIHVATVGLHRPFSDLKFNPIEDISSCARDPAPDIPTPELVNVHTVRVLRSVEAQIRLLALPVSEFHHTPFTTCMISEGTLALLSSCCFLLKGVELTVARAQIRMTIGCLRALGELWPRTARNVREIQTIAHHVLGLESARNHSTPPSSQVGSGGGQGTSGLDAGAWGDSIDIVPSLNSLEDLCGWYNLDNFDTDYHWEMNNMS